MDYKIVVTKDAEEDLDRFIKYLVSDDYDTEDEYVEIIH